MINAVLSLPVSVPPLADCQEFGCLRWPVELETLGIGCTVCPSLYFQPNKVDTGMTAE